MKKIILIGAAGLLAASCSAMGMAIGNNFYVGGLVGYGEPQLHKTEYSGAAGANSTSSRVGGLAWSGLIGYQEVTAPHWLTGIEFSYDENGDAEYNYPDGGTVKVLSSDMALLLTETYVFDSGFNVFGKAGVARFDQRTSNSGTLSGSTEYIRARPIVKVGAGYLFDFGSDGSLNLFGQFSRVFASNNASIGTAAISTNTVGGGFTYHFPA